MTKTLRHEVKIEEKTILQLQQDAQYRENFLNYLADNFKQEVEQKLIWELTKTQKKKKF